MCNIILYCPPISYSAIMLSDDNSVLTFKAIFNDKTILPSIIKMCFMLICDIFSGATRYAGYLNLQITGPQSRSHLKISTLAVWTWLPFSKVSLASYKRFNCISFLYGTRNMNFSSFHAIRWHRSFACSRYLEYRRQKTLWSFINMSAAYKRTEYSWK